jgi:hypothetical protein
MHGELDSRGAPTCNCVQSRQTPVMQALFLIADSKVNRATGRLLRSALIHSRNRSNVSQTPTMRFLTSIRTLMGNAVTSPSNKDP